jgi:tetratricopeptide (TPR) repeat protein
MPRALITTPSISSPLAAGKEETMRLLSLATLLVLLLIIPAVGQQPEKLGTVNFPTSCNATAQAEFTRAVALLHSFWFQHAIKGFEAAVKADPTCGIAAWGAAVAWLGNPLAGPPPAKNVELGAATVARARSMGAKTQRELDYIAAIEAFYKDHDKVDHRTRALAYEKAMEALAAKYPQDREAAIFYALALNITLNPNDKTYANQLKAAAILEPVFKAQPDHPGVAHYLIHSYDFPPIADKGVDAARRYAAIAPSAPHAQHMPSHIFTRLGYWQESIETNRASVVAAKDELRQARLEAGSYNALHAMDYIVYAALQLAKDREAKAVYDELKTIDKLDTEHFAAAFAFAAIPARYTLERREWSAASELTLHPQSLSWPKFPQAESILVFARGLGAARGGNVAGAKTELARIEALRDRMTAAKNTYWAEQSEIQRLAVAGWIARAEKRNDEAVKLMRASADLEAKTEKHPVTPGAIQPAREMLGELLLELGQNAQALAEFEMAMRTDPNRLHGLAGAALAAKQAGNADKARLHYQQLLVLTKDADTERPELKQARAYLGK